MSIGNNKLHVIKASAGTGKTYNLAAHYIALLMNKASYRSILAVTFTNKATTVMKHRIISNLNAIATSPLSPTDHTRIANKKVHDFLNCVRKVSKNRGLPEYDDSVYQCTAKELVPVILSDFDNMRIQTIDSFLQTLLSGLAHALGQTAGFSVNLDLKKSISDAIDEVLTFETRDNEEINNAVVNCLRDRLKSEVLWDLRPVLLNMAQKLYSEKVQMFREKVATPTAKHKYAQQLRDYKTSPLPYESKPEYQELCALYDKMKDYEKNGAIPGGSTYYTMIRNVGKTIISRDIGVEKLFVGLSEKDYNSFARKVDSPKKYEGLPNFIVSKFKNNQTLGMSYYDDLHRMHELLGILHQPIYIQQYARRQACCKYINELQLVGYVLDRIHADQCENNTFLLAETANTLVRALKENDALFILEKAGIRYQHIMLDEFQDTSILQWANFRELVLELLSQGGSALIVGDVKQSIYRWRNGDYEIMQGLNQDSDLKTYYDPDQLKCNFRSRKAIVAFNADTFKQLSEKEEAIVKEMYKEDYTPEVLSNFYNSSNSGGYVCLRRFTPANAKETNIASGEEKTEVLTQAQQNEKAREALLDFMFDRMEMLLDSGYEKKEMFILTRGKTEAKRVVKRFNELIVDKAKYPHLAQAGKIVSRDSFLLSSSIAVQTIISALSYLSRHDGVGLQFLKTNYPDIDITAALKGLHCGLPLNILVDRIISELLCTTEIPSEDSSNPPSKVYAGEDIAHLNCFRDKLRSYVNNHGSDVKDFLRNWDDYMCEETVPVCDSNDITMLTIHSAKGLEAKNVFIPFCGWAMEETDKKAATMWCEVDDLVPGEKLMMPVKYGDNTELAMPNEHAEERLHERIDALNLLYVACTRAEDNLFVLVYDDTSAAGQLLVNLYNLQPNGMIEWDGQGRYETPSDLEKMPTRPQMQLPIKKEEDNPEPFSFEGVAPLNATCSSSGATIAFRQSQQARQLLIDQAQAAAAPDDYAKADDSKQTYYTLFGTLCHSILEHVRIAEDVERAVSEASMRGQIPSETVKKNITDLISRLMQHRVAGEWFTEKWTLLREDTILWPNEEGEVKEIRMDRVMINGQQAVVLDYKFGREEPEYEIQVHNYMQALRDMGYTDVRGYLWFGFRNYLKEVK